MKKLYIVSLIVLALCFALPVMAESGSLCVKTDRMTNMSMGPGNNYPKSGVFSRKTFEYTGVTLMDDDGNMWHKVLNGEAEMWLNAADSTVLYEGQEMPEERILVTIATVNIRSAPGSEYELIAVAEAGEKFICIGEYRPYSDGDIWYMISMENGAAWLNSRYAAPADE